MPNKYFSSEDPTVDQDDSSYSPAQVLTFLKTIRFLYRKLILRLVDSNNLLVDPPPPSRI